MARRVLIAGATGQIGRPLTQTLVAAGDEVYGLARSEESAARVSELGATPVRGDALDRAEVIASVAEAQPDVIVHQLTAIPTEVPNPREFTSLFGPTNRLRREATRHLVDAAAEVGTGRVLAQSIAFAYRVEGAPEIVDESGALDTGADGAFGEIVRAVSALEEAVLSSGAGGVVMRYGMLYGPDTAYSRDGALGSLVAQRRFPVVGDGAGRQPFIHLDDALSATLALMDRGTGVYNVVDDDPARAREWVPGLAEALGAKQPLRVPRWVARVAAGPDAVRAMTEQRGASNTRLRTELGWEPRYPSWREGFATL